MKEAGRPFSIGPGNPNWCERVESGLISYGGDTDTETNPFEVRMGKYVDLDLPDDVIGIRALRRIKAEVPKRHSLGIVMDSVAPMSIGFRWAPVLVTDRKVGDLTNLTWSYRLKQNIGFVLISTTCSVGDRVVVIHGQHSESGTLTELPFI